MREKIKMYMVYAVAIMVVIATTHQLMVSGGYRQREIVEVSTSILVLPGESYQEAAERIYDENPLSYEYDVPGHWATLAQEKCPRYDCLKGGEMEITYYKLEYTTSSK